jgi:uncharacterized protein YrrD
MTNDQTVGTNRSMDIREGTKVFTHQGEAVGEVDRIVVDPMARRVRDLVLKEGVLIRHDRVLPLDRIATVTPDGIVLDAGVDVEDLEEFEEIRYLPYQPGEVEGSWKIVHHAGVYPPLTVPTPGAWLAYERPPRQEVIRNVPPGSVALDRGTRVVSTDGHTLGKLDEVITDAKGELTHIVVRKGWLRRTRRAYPSAWITDDTDSTIRLGVHSSIAERVPEHPAV